MAIQTEGLASHNKRIQAEEILNDAPSSNDPILLELQEKLVQAHLALAQCKKETVPLQKYQELQKQFNDLTITKDETFAKLRQEEEKLRKVKAKLDKAVG